MAHSVIDAIRSGKWDFDPEHSQPQNYRATGAMPGTDAKLSILAERVRMGLPLWHPSDRRDYDQMNHDYE